MRQESQPSSVAPLTPADMDRAIDEHFRYELEDDVDGVMATLAEQVEHDIVGWPTGPTGDHEQVRAFYSTLFQDLADGKVETIRRLYGEDFMVDESRWTGTAAGRPMGLDGRGRPVSFRLLHVMQFTAEGKVAKEQVWLDLASMMAQLPPLDVDAG